MIYLSNAFFKSKKTTALINPPSMLRAQLSDASSRSRNRRASVLNGNRTDVLKEDYT